MKLKLLALTLGLLVVSQMQGQITPGSNWTEDRPYPTGLPGSYANPIVRHGLPGGNVTLGDFHLGLISQWYAIEGWYAYPFQLRITHVYYDLQTPHIGQFLTKTVGESDYNHWVYGVRDSTNGEWTYYRIALGNPAIDPSGLNP